MELDTSLTRGREDIFSYEEKEVKSFSEAVEKIVEENINSQSGVFCLVDVDGTLIADKLVQYPGICHLVTPVITEETQLSFRELFVSLGGNLGIYTNRNTWERMFWNSDKVLEKVQDLVNRCYDEIPLFGGLSKQLPGFARKACDDVVEFLAQKAVSGSLQLIAIEDESFVSPNRQSFLVYLAKRLKDEKEIHVEITNYVIY